MSLYSPSRELGPISSRKKKKESSYESELDPVYDQYKAEAEKKDLLSTAWETVADLLSRTQYVTSNVVEDVISTIQGKPKNPLQGAWEGLTGKRKGSWKETLWGGRSEGETEDFKGIFQSTEGTKAKTMFGGKMSVEDFTGLLGDIFLDIGNISFGATKLGKAAAKQFAKQSTLSFIKNSDLVKDIFRLTKGAVSSDALNGLIKADPDKAMRIVKKAAPGGMARQLNDIYKSAFNDALKKSPDVLKQEYLNRLNTVKDAFTKATSEAFAGYKSGRKWVGELAKEVGQEGITKGVKAGELAEVYGKIFQKAAESGTFTKKTQQSVEKLKQITEEIGGVDKLFGETLKGLGEKSGKYLWWDFNKGIREQGPVSKTFDALKQGFERTKVGGAISDKFSDLVYAAQTKGPIGWLRKAFGVKNPYQTIVNAVRMEHVHGIQKIEEDLKRELVQTFGKTPKEDMNKLRDLLADLEIKNTKDITPDSIAAAGLKEGDQAKFQGLLDKYRGFTDKLKKVEDEWATKLGMAESGYRINYLPGFRKAPQGPAYGMGQGSFKQTKSFLFAERMGQDSALIQNLFGLDQAAADYAIKELGWGATNTDLMQMLAIRSHMHARAVANAQFLDSISNFGFKFDNQVGTIGKTFDGAAPGELASKRELAQFLMSQGQQIEQLGLRKVSSSVLADYYFDDDVARAIDRISPVMQKDGVFAALDRVVSKAMSWWKGMATLSPGFHVRNAKNNTWVLFVQHGEKMMNVPKFVKDGHRAAAGVAYGLYGEKVFEGGLSKALSGIGLTPARINKYLNTVINGKAVREWVDEARKAGIISGASIGFEELQKESLKQSGKLRKIAEAANVFDTKNIFTKASREIGSIVESQPKFLSFLWDIESMAGKGAAAEAVVDMAKANVAKYYFDYQDLTKFEEKLKTYVIPFYTFLRKNIAMNLTMLWEQRSKLAIAAKTEGAVEVETVKPQDLYQYIRELGGVVTSEEGGKIGVDYPQLGYTDLNKIPLKFDMENELGIPIPKLDTSEVYDEFLSMAHPLIKTATSVMGKGYDPFRRRDLDSKSPAPRIMRLFAANPKLMMEADALVKSLGHEKGLNPSKDPDTGKLMIDAKIAYVLEANFPLFSRIDQIGDAFSSVFPQIDQEIEKMSGYKSGVDEVNTKLKRVSFLLGVSEREYDLDKIAEQKERAILKKAEEKVQEERRLKPGYQKRITEYSRRQKARLRRLNR